MAYYYADLVKFIALRTRQIVGGSAATRKAAYVAASLEAYVDGTELPWSAYKQDILAVEAELAELCGNSNIPILKRPLAARSAVVTTGSAIPLNDESGFKFVGAFDAILDETTGKALTEAPVQLIQDYLADQAATKPYFKVNPYHFAYQGEIIVHTTTAGVRFRGCSWDFATQSTAYNTAASTPAAITYDETAVDTTTNLVTNAAHGYFTGLRVRVSSTTVLPAPLAADTDYWLVCPTVDTYGFATTLANALAGVLIDLTTQGTAGVDPHTTTPQGSSGGGQSPLAYQLQVLHGAQVLSQVLQEDWFAQEANYYRSFAAEKKQELMEGKLTAMRLPAMPETQARVASAKD